MPNPTKFVKVQPNPTSSGSSKTAVPKQVNDASVAASNEACETEATTSRLPGRSGGMVSEG